MCWEGKIHLLPAFRCHGEHKPMGWQRDQRAALSGTTAELQTHDICLRSSSGFKLAASATRSRKNTATTNPIFASGLWAALFNMPEALAQGEPSTGLVGTPAGMLISAPCHLVSCCTKNRTFLHREHLSLLQGDLGLPWPGHTDLISRQQQFVQSLLKQGTEAKSFQCFGILFSIFSEDVSSPSPSQTRVESWIPTAIEQSLLLGKETEKHVLSYKTSVKSIFQTL